MVEATPGIGHLQKSHVHWNYLVNMFDGALFAFALSFVSLVTVLPVFVKRLGGSNVELGLILVIWVIGFNIPQILIANHARGYPYKKTLLIRTAIVQRLPWLFLGILAFFLVEKVPGLLARVLFFLCFALAAIGGSLNLPGWFDLIAKVIPVTLRGRLFAMRSIFGAALGIGGGWLVHRILDTVPYPSSFGLLFIIAFATMMISYIFLVSIKEEVPNPPKERWQYGEFFRQLQQILRQEKNYRNFLVADALLITAMMANTFFTVHALQRFALTDAHAGKFTMAIMISMIFSSPVFGALADKAGHKLNLILAGGFTTLACITALLAGHLTLYYLVFICIAFTNGIIQVSRLSIIAELCSEEDRPTYVALTNLITAPFVLTGILGGWFADRFGYSVVFVISGVMALGAIVWMWNMVREPRQLTFQPQTEGAR